MLHFTCRGDVSILNRSRSTHAAHAPALWSVADLRGGYTSTCRGGALCDRQQVTCAIAFRETGDAQDIDYTYCMPLSWVIQHMVYQSLPTSIPFGKAIPRRRKEDRHMGRASHGLRERWCRVSSRVRPRGHPGARCGADAVQLPRGQPWMPAVTLLDGRDRLSAQRLAMVSTYRAPSRCRPVHRALLRNALLDLTPILHTTVCYKIIYVETYSKFSVRRI